MMKEYYTIGEISRIFGVSIDTLRYYSKIGLIVPKRVGKNQYRYYSIEQFEIISTVLFLRSVDTPIHKINDMLHHSDISKIQNELLKQECILQGKINHLRQLKSTVESFNSLSQRFQCNPSITVEQIPRLWVLAQPFHTPDVELNPNEVAKFHHGITSSWLLTANIISTLSPSSIFNRQYHTYSRYGLISEFSCDAESPYLTVLEEGPYVTTTTKIYEANHSDVDQVYDLMLQYIHEHHLVISGEAYERNVMDMYTNTDNNTVHFLKIYIPINDKGRC